MRKPIKPGESESYRRSWIRRQRAIEIMGGICQSCGFADSRALQITPAGTGTSFLNQVLKNPQDYDLSCANCNQIKRATEVPESWKAKVADWKFREDFRSGKSPAESLISSSGDFNQSSARDH